MAKSFPAPVIARQQASGGSAPVSLLEVYTLSGNLYFWSDALLITGSVLATYSYSGPAPVRPLSIGGVLIPPGLTFVPLATFVPWIITPPKFHSYRSITTTTGQVEIQNVSGDTVRRDVSQIFSRQEMMGALVFYRQWMEDAEYATDTFQGNVDGVDIDADGTTMSLSLSGMWRWSKIKAPDQQIGVSCGWTFASPACGSTSPTPCSNSYGTCTSTNRFNGTLLEWNGATLSSSQYVQPEPLRLFNARSAG